MSRAGFAGQFLVGWFTSNHTHAEWSVVFFVTAGVTIVGTLIYLIFARADVQPWAQDDEPQDNSACAGTGNAGDATEPLNVNAN